MSDILFNNSAQRLGPRLRRQRITHKRKGGLDDPEVKLDCCCSVTKLCPTLCNLKDCSTPGFLVLHYLPGFAQIHVHWVGDAISSSAALFFCLQSLPASESSPMSRLFPSGGQSTGASASASVLPMNIQGWFPLGLTGLIFLQSKGLSRLFLRMDVINVTAYSIKPTRASHFRRAQPLIYSFYLRETDSPQICIFIIWSWTDLGPLITSEKPFTFPYSAMSKFLPTHIGENS